MCQECGTNFEHLQSFSAKGQPNCPQCHSQHVARKLSRPAIHFKGSGWYITDSKGSSKQSANGGKPIEGEESAKPASTESPKVEGAGAKPPATNTGEKAAPAAAPASE